MIASIMAIVGWKSVRAARQEAENKQEDTQDRGYGPAESEPQCTRSLGSSGLSSILLWLLAGLAGCTTAGGFFLLAKSLEVAFRMAQ